jgi:exocyst complex component 3
MSTAAPVSAAQAVGEYLQSPDDLLKIAAFRKKLEKEKASIDARLKTGVKEQLDATREGLRKLFGTRNNVQIIKDELETVDRESSNPQNVVMTFDQISRVRTQFVSYRRDSLTSLSFSCRCLWYIGTLNRRRRW